MPGVVRRAERGSAVVDFVLVLVVLIPVILGIVQVALVLHVRNTLTAAASEGARFAGTLDRGLEDGRAKTREQIAGAISERFAERIVVEQVMVDGVPGVRVTVRATVPPLGIGGPGVPVEVSGHAVEESVDGAP